MLFVQGTDLRWKQGMRGCRVPTLLEMQVSEAGDMAQKEECLLSMHKALDVIPAIPTLSRWEQEGQELKVIMSSGPIQTKRDGEMAQ